MSYQLKLDLWNWHQKFKSLNNILHHICKQLCNEVVYIEADTGGVL